MGLDEATALRAAGDGSYEGDVDARWWTPRGPLGGYVMALAMRALMLAVDDASRPPRSLTLYFLSSPKAEPVTLRPLVERTGRSMTMASVRMEQSGVPVALGLAAFSGPWSGETLDESPMPEVEPPAPRTEARQYLDEAPRPPFRELLVMQRRFGAPFFTRADHAETGGWLGLREERPMDALSVVLLADAWFPAPWPRVDELMPAPTIEMTVYFRAPLPLPDPLLLGRFRTSLVRDGFFEETGELWTPDGTLVAQSRQLALLLQPPDRA